MEEFAKKEKKERYDLLDGLRGAALLQMVFFHFLYDLKYIVGLPMEWYRGKGVYLWQQEICWLFVLIAGFCLTLGRKPVRRGVLLTALGGLVTLVTIIFLPSERIVFGILNFLGAAALFLTLLRRFLQKCPPKSGIFWCMILFFFTRNVSDGFLGFFGIPLAWLPQTLYRGIAGIVCGFPPPGFYSSDYVPLLPGIFVFAAGWFLAGFCREREDCRKLLQTRMPGFAWLGRHSLQIYLLHQPILYGIVLAFGSI